MSTIAILLQSQPICKVKRGERMMGIACRLWGTPIAPRSTRTVLISTLEDARRPVHGFHWLTPPHCLIEKANQKFDRLTLARRVYMFWGERRKKGSHTVLPHTSQQRRPDGCTPSPCHVSVPSTGPGPRLFLPRTTPIHSFCKTTSLKGSYENCSFCVVPACPDACRPAHAGARIEGLSFGFARPNRVC